MVGRWVFLCSSPQPYSDEAAYSLLKGRPYQHQNLGKCGSSYVNKFVLSRIELKPPAIGQPELHWIHQYPTLDII